MKSRAVNLAISEALHLAGCGGFMGNPTLAAPKFVRGAFGEGLVRGWLTSLGYEIKRHLLVIRAEDFGLDILPSFRRWRLIEVVASNETLAVEVKTYGDHSLQGSCDTLEDQLANAPMWRNSSSRRRLALAILLPRPTFHWKQSYPNLEIRDSRNGGPALAAKVGSPGFEPIWVHIHRRNQSKMACLCG
jgi:hypothetical protein